MVTPLITALITLSALILPTTVLAGSPADQATPAEVSAYLKRRSRCEHLRGEDPGDRGARSKQVHEAWARDCTGIDAAHISLLTHYRSNSRVFNLLADYEHCLEPSTPCAIMPSRPIRFEPGSTQSKQVKPGRFVWSGMAAEQLHAGLRFIWEEPNGKTKQWELTQDSFAPKVVCPNDQSVCEFTSQLCYGRCITDRPTIRSTGMTDGTVLFTVPLALSSNAPHEVFLADPRLRTVIRLFQIEQASYVDFFKSPSGRYLVYVSGNHISACLNRDEVRVFDLVRLAHVESLPHSKVDLAHDQSESFTLDR